MFVICGFTFPSQFPIILDYLLVFLRLVSLHVVGLALLGVLQTVLGLRFIK